MRDIDLYSTVGTVVSVCDSINYLLEDEDVADTFSLVENYLYPGGIFIFDFNTLYKYETVIGDTTIAENRDDCSSRPAIPVPFFISVCFPVQPCSPH